MSSHFVESVYFKLPILAQNTAVSLQGRREARVRFGPYFREKLEQLADSDWWSAEQLKAYQSEKLQDLLSYAYTNVPYYEQLMRRLRLRPSDFRSPDDLQKLPILTKEDVRANAPQLLSRIAEKRNLVHRHTSGTTGKSLHFYTSKNGIAFQWAVWWRHRERFGLRFGDQHVNFTGKLVIPANQSRPPYWRFNNPMHQALITMHHLTPAKISSIVEFLDGYDATFYSGYPSILHTLCVLAADAGLPLSRRPKSIVTGAENILDFQRRDIERYLGAQVTDQYGFSEGAGNASQCERLIYHEDAEFGIMECADPTPVGPGLTQGRIVCTGFANPEFPLIRYDVGDSATWNTSGHACSCGRSSREIVAIDGRKDDYVITPEGRRIMRFDYVFKDSASIKESQVVQRELGEVLVRLVPRSTFKTSDTAFIRAEIHRWISPTLRVEFEVVPEIERERGGKYRAVKSLLHDAAVAS